MLINGRQYFQLRIVSLEYLAKNNISLCRCTFPLIVINIDRIKMTYHNHKLWWLLKCTIVSTKHLFNHLLFSIPHLVVRVSLRILFFRNFLQVVNSNTSVFLYIYEYIKLAMALQSRYPCSYIESTFVHECVESILAIYQLPIFYALFVKTQNNDR